MGGDIPDSHCRASTIAYLKDCAQFYTLTILGPIAFLGTETVEVCANGDVWASDDNGNGGVSLGAIRRSGQVLHADETKMLAFEGTFDDRNCFGSGDWLYVGDESGKTGGTWTLNRR